MVSYPFALPMSQPRIINADLDGAAERSVNQFLARWIVPIILALGTALLSVIGYAANTTLEQIEEATSSSAEEIAKINEKLDGQNERMLLYDGRLTRMEERQNEMLQRMNRYHPY